MFIVMELHQLCKLTQKNQILNDWDFHTLHKSQSKNQIKTFITLVLTHLDYRRFFRIFNRMQKNFGSNMAVGIYPQFFI